MFDTAGSSSAPKDSVAKQLLDSSAAVDVYFKGEFVVMWHLRLCKALGI
jgi:hypothetical protein